MVPFGWKAVIAVCYTQVYLMHLFACGSTGKSAELPRQAVDWEVLVRLAREQSVVHVVALAIKRSPQLPVPEPIRTELLSALMGTALRNRMRADAILQLLGKMHDSGIQVLLLKGMAAARLYRNPECRESADTDILVLPQDEEKTLQFLQNEGFAVTPRQKDMHHARCTHPTLGLFEVHVSLWEEYLDDVMFDSLIHNAALRANVVTVQTEDGSFQTIGTNETLLFLTMHMMKHFIDGGITLRQMMDLSLFYKTYADEADTAYHWDLLEKLDFARTVRAVYHAAVLYFGFEKTDFPGIGEAEPEDIETVLTDMFTGGWNGVNEKEDRYDTWMLYRKAKEKKNLGRIYVAMRYLRVLRSETIPHIFPPYAELSEEYPALKKAKILYPLFCLVRILRKSRKRSDKQSRESKTATQTQADDRLRMLKRLGVL